MPTFISIRLIVCVVAVAVAALVVMSIVGGRAGVLKKQGVAWALALLMIITSVGIGRAKARNTGYNSPVPEPTRPPAATSVIPASADSRVFDEAGVLSSSTEKKLDRRNAKLMEDMSTLIAVVTCNYGRDDLYDYALKRAEEMDLDRYDFIVVLDISGENYWLVQGSGLYDEGWFSDDDCSDYARKYMEKDFAKGDYDGAVLSLTEALEEWYYDNY